MKMTVSERTKQYARSRAVDHMDASVIVYRPRDPQVVFDELTGRSHIPEHSILYTGQARVWSVDTSNTLILGEVDIAQASTYISIPYDSADVRNGDVIRVDEHPSAKFRGKSFTVVGVNYGGFMDATIRMSCTALTPSNSWSPDG